MTLKLIGAIICWVIAFTFFTLGFVVVTSEKRKTETIFGIKLSDIEASADSVFVWVIFLIINTIAGILNALPWWIVKIVYILIGIGFSLLGIKLWGGGS